MSKWIIVAVAYALVGLFTFGHVAASWDGEICHVGTTIEGPCDANNKAAAGIVGGLAWPFYWSWELQS